MANNIDEMTEKQLARQLEQLGLEVTGTRAVLRERLRRALGANGEASTGSNGGGLANARENIDDVQSREVSAQQPREASSAKSVDAMKKRELQEKLGELGLSMTGLKADLRQRLKAALREGDEVSDDDESEEDESVEDGQITMRSRDVAGGPVSVAPSYDGIRIQRREREHSMAVHSILSFKDVEDALETFSGDGTQNVRRWFVSFEETADLCRWSETQKIVYLKKLLRGSAKLFANYECHARSWKELKQSLIDEFGPTMNSRQVHKELSAVVKKPSETYQEYVYRVLELASHSEMELE